MGEAIHAFMEMTRWSIPEKDDGGATWLEFFVRFTQVGGHVGATNNTEDKYRPNVPMQDAFAAFKKAVRKVADTCICDEDQIFSRPRKHQE